MSILEGLSFLWEKDVYKRQDKNSCLSVALLW